MSLKEYVVAKIPMLCFYGIFILLLTLILAIADFHFLLILILDGFLLCSIAAYFTMDYFLQNNRLKQLKSLINKVENKHLIGEILPKPASAIQQEYFKVMKTVSHSAISAVAKAEQDKEDYCEFIENWVHEIKTPLTACSLILKNGADPFKLKRELKRAENQTESILYYARLKNVEKDIVITKFSVKSIIDEAIKSQSEILMASGISVRVDGDFEVYSDAKSFCFILKQLLINCAKYAPKGEVAIVANNNSVTVKDNGMGIPSHEILRVTARGFTGENGRKIGFGGTGMGLYIVDGLCKNLDIKLEIESKINRFTAVTLRFSNLTKM